MMMKIARGAAVLGAIGLAVAAVQTDGMAVPVLTVGAVLFVSLGVAIYGAIKTVNTRDDTPEMVGLGS